MSPHKDAEVGCDESPCILACCSPVGTDIEVPPCLEVGTRASVHTQSRNCCS